MKKSYISTLVVLTGLLSALSPLTVSAQVTRFQQQIGSMECVEDQVESGPLAEVQIVPEVCEQLMPPDQPVPLDVTDEAVPTPQAPNAGVLQRLTAGAQELGAGLIVVIALGIIGVLKLLHNLKQRLFTQRHI